MPEPVRANLTLKDIEHQILLTNKKINDRLDRAKTSKRTWFYSQSKHKAVHVADAQCGKQQWVTKLNY